MLKQKELPPCDYLYECFNYDSETGVLSWKYKRPLHHFKNKTGQNIWEGRFSNANIDCIGEDGYLRVYIYKSLFRVHRIIWKMVTGEDAIGYEIDHIDNNKLNNVFNNLRLVTTAENQQNVKLKITNMSGIKGIDWHKQKQMWRARVCINYNRVLVGHYHDIIDAEKAIVAARENLHTHYNHG